MQHLSGKWTFTGLTKWLGHIFVNKKNVAILFSKAINLWRPNSSIMASTKLIRYVKIYLSWLPKISETKRCSIYIVNDHWFWTKNLLRISFQVFVSRYVNENYNTHDVNCVDKNMIYSALCRTHKFEFIQLDKKQLTNK